MSQMIQAGSQEVKMQGPRPMVDAAYGRPRVDPADREQERRRQREQIPGGKRYTVECPRALRYATLSEVLSVLQTRNVTYRIDVEKMSSTNGLMDGQDTIVYSFELTTDRSHADMFTLGEELERFGFAIKLEPRV